MSTLELVEDDIVQLMELNCQLLLEIAALTSGKLNENQEELKKCKWTDGEANTDTGFSELACKCAEEAWLLIKQRHPTLNLITMVASIPDINCMFSKNGKIIELQKTKIELKSSKNIQLPGSTIRKLDINQPLIYCYRPTSDDGLYEVRWGQYYDGMVPKTDIELFQDRTPRPNISFNNLFTSSQMKISYSEKEKDDWIPHYGACAFNRVRQEINRSWQDKLTKSIIFEALKNIETIEELNKLRDLVRPT